MHVVFVLNIFLLSFLFQSTLSQYITVGGVRPDLILLLACLSGLFYGRHRGLVLGALAGALQDCLSGGLFGLNTLSKSLVGFATGVLQQHVGVHHRLAQMVVVGLMTALDGLLTLSLVSMYRERALLVSHVLLILSYQMAYNALLAAPYFALLSRLARRYLPAGGYADLPAASSGLRGWLNRTSFRFR